MVFLSIVTRTCQRPRMLAECIQSVRAQTDSDIEQVFIVDRARKGIQHADKSLAINKDRMSGEWSMILDDDCWLINNWFVEHLKGFAEQNTEANVIMFKSKRPKGPPSNETVFPAKHIWGKTPVHGTTNCLCYVIKTPIWKKRIEYFGIKNWGGDWWLLDRIIQDGHKLFWLNELMAESRQLGRGKIFEDVKPGWFERVARQEGLVNLGKDDWRLCLWNT